jgi:hypothetical protein
MARFSEDVCAACGSDMTRGFIRNPSIFGKHYGDWCFACWHVPDLARFEETGERVLKDLEYMTDGGWSKKESLLHIKAVKKLLKMRG